LKAMLLRAFGPIEGGPLECRDVAVPEPGPGELLVRVTYCGVCHTDLHTVEGELAGVSLPRVPGHEVVGVVAGAGEGAGGRFATGERIGVAWLHRTCGRCQFCLGGRENLCPDAVFTGLCADGGYAEYLTVPETFAYAVPKTFGNAEAAPLLCAGIIGYRALRVSGIAPGGALGLYGFGASAHIAVQIARHWGCEVYAFSRSDEHRRLAKELGASWTGTAQEEPPRKLDAAVIFAPAGGLVPEALRALERGGTVALAGISMTPIPELDYDRYLYHEKALRSVANATRQDGSELMRLAEEIPIRTTVRTFSLAEANAVLRSLKDGRVSGAAVLEI
jgi:alcohol dehydrogenase, propanol-preferring